MACIPTRVLSLKPWSWIAEFKIACPAQGREARQNYGLYYPQEFFPLGRGVGFRNLKSRAHHKGEKRGKTMACITHKSPFP